MSNIQEVNCRICGSKTETILDFGEVFLSGFVKDQSQAIKAPLALAKCQSCGLVQLKHSVDLDTMYRQYWYSSSLNKSMVSSLKNIVQEVENTINLNYGDVVLDIGCNDGTLLDLYTKDVLTVGFDPARNLRTPRINHFVNDYFSADKYHDLTRPKVITAIAMFYDLPDPNKFVADVKEILADDGIFIVQFTDLLSMFKVNAFDNICHEHLEYYRLEDVVSLLESHDLQVIDVSYNDVNGGSVRVTAACTGAFEPSRAVEHYLTEEEKFLSEYSFEDFKKEIEATKNGVQSLLQVIKKGGLTMCMLGASTKGNSLLQICGVKDGDIPFAAEVNPDKFGLYTVGSNIKILSEDEVLAMKPDLLFVPIWHFKESILKSEKMQKFMQGGGLLVFPLPEAEIIGRSPNYGKDVSSD